LPDNTVHQNGFTLSLNSTHFAYQWVDCNNGNAPIVGETNATYTATANGDYAVLISNGSCVLSSNCINVTGLQIGSLDKDLSVQVYPNPATTILYFSKDHDEEIKIDLIDNLGRVLVTTKLQKRMTELSVGNIPTGVYYLFINNGTQATVQKIIKQ
jgi:hypothetical protein